MHYAVLMMLFTTFFHLFFLLSMAIYFTGHNYLRETFGTNHNKYFALPVVILIWFLVRLYFRKKGPAILEGRDFSVVKWWIILLTLLIIIAPLLIGIQIMNRGLRFPL